MLEIFNTCSFIYATTPQVDHIAPGSDLARYDADIKHACLEVKTRVSGSQIWLQERIAEILAGSVPVIFGSLA